MANVPLTGKRILITRAREQSAGFAHGLRKLGAEVIEFPTIEILPPLRWDNLDRSLDRLDAYDWLIFTSANGVKFFWQRLEERRMSPSLPSSLKVCAIGPATAKKLREQRVRIDYVPEEYVAEAILNGFEAMPMSGKRALLARARVARDVLPKGLRKMGARVDVVEVYRTVKPRGGAAKLRRLFSEGRIDAVTFTSSSTVNHFVDLLKKEDLDSFLKDTVVASIGPITTGTAREQGLEVRIQPEEYTIPALTKAIADYFSRK
jgi:uroporphyrinogen III methyltransferase/synthase